MIIALIGFLHAAVLGGHGGELHQPGQPAQFAAVQLGTAAGYTSFTQSPDLWFRGLIIPWLTLSFLYVGFYARVLRANLIEIQNEDFVRTARAKGLRERRVLIRHTLRNSMVTFVSLFGLDFGALVGGGAI